MLQLLLPYLAALVSSQRGSGSRCGSFALWVAGKSLLIFPEDLEANRAEGLKEGLLFPGADQASAEIVRKKSLLQLPRVTHRCRCLQRPASLRGQNGCG